VRRLILPVVAAFAVIAGVLVVAVMWPESDSDPIDDALAVMPADAEIVTFTDTAAAHERLGHGDLTSESSEHDVDEFINASLETAPWGASSLGASFALMEGWGWNWADVVWEAEYHSEDSYATAYKLRDDLDMETVRESFAENGYEGSDVDGYPAYSLDVQTVSGDQVVVELLNIVLMPDDHLLLAGPDAESLLAAATDDADSLADTDPAAELVDAVDAPEYLMLVVGESSCVDTRRPGGVDPSALEDLQPITGYVAAATASDGDLAAQVVSTYAGEDAAAADVGPRTELLENGTSLLTNQPYSELYSAEVEGDGSTVRYDLGGPDVARSLPQFVQASDVPWAYCPRES
jgi:hypothetical protein